MASRKTFAAIILMIFIIMQVLRTTALTCLQSQYEILDRCCPMCDHGQRVEADCTRRTNTICQPCIKGFFMDHPTKRTQCFPCTECSGPGLREKTSCTTTSDAVCEPLEGHYCVDDNCKTTKKHTTCLPGQYIREKGTASRDTECSDCRNGTFSDGTFTSCRPHTLCGSGSQLIKPGTAERDSECEEDWTRAVVISVVVLILLVGIIIYCIKKKITLQDVRRKFSEINGCFTKETPGGAAAGVNLPLTSVTTSS